jgi:hypothetical protein
MTALFMDGHVAATPIRQRAVRAFRRDALDVEEGLRWLWLASSEASKLWDHESWLVLSARHVDMARAAGALGVLPLTLNSCAVAHAFAGELETAASLVSELDAVQQATWHDPRALRRLGARRLARPGARGRRAHRRYAG